MNLAFDVPYYLGVTVGTDGEMTPRHALSSSAYAFRAQNADNAGGWIYTGNTISLGTGTDNVGIGTTSPTEKLQVNGNLKLNGDLKTDRWLNTEGNTFLGVNAGGPSLMHVSGADGYYNTAIGDQALNNITTGDSNTAVLLRRQTGVCSTASCYAIILQNPGDYVCDVGNNPTGCAPHFDLTANNVLTADSGLLYLTLELAFSSDTSWIEIGGVKLTVSHN